MNVDLMNEFLKTEIRALRRKKATHVLPPKIRGGKREDEITRREPWRLSNHSLTNQEMKGQKLLF